MISFTVPGQPVGKARARTVVQGGKTHSFTPAKTARYEAFVAGVYKSLYPGAKPLTSPVELCIDAFFEIPKSWPVEKRKRALAGMIFPTVKGDFDNIAKAVSDALNGLAWEDDKQVVYAVIRKVYAAEPRVEIRIQPLDAECAY